MSEKEQITLEGQAVEEILREARRSKELANDLGAFGWKKREALPNKRFLNNTLVSTLRHGYREDRKHRIGSNKKYHDHMNNRHSRSRNYYRNHGNREEIVEPEPEGPEPDYGEFDAIAYSDKCTDLYIRDSHRKHSFMRGNFVEKHHKGSSSESEESYTEYDQPQSDKQYHDRFKSKWSDTGSADEYAEDIKETSKIKPNYEKQNQWKQTTSHRKDRGKSGRLTDSNDRSKKWIGHSCKDYMYKRKSYDRNDDAGTSRHHEDWDKSEEKVIENYQSRKKIKKDQIFIPETDEDSDRECLNSGTESADNTDKPDKIKTKGKKSRKIPNDGKGLWEKISSRSMYADIEEMKMKKDMGVVKQADRIENRSLSKKIKLDREERRRKYLEKKQKDEEEKELRLAKKEKEEEERRDAAERERKSESLKRLADRKRKETEMRYEAERERNEMRRIADMHWQEEQMRLAAFEYFRGHPPRAQFRGRSFMRGRPFFRGRPPRGFRGGFPMFPPVNPFYASFFNDIDPYLLQKFIKEYGHKFRKSKQHGHNSESRSRSRSRSRSHRYKKKKRRHYSYSDTSSSRSRSRSQSKRYSSRYSSSSSRSRSRSYSKHRSRGSSRYRSRDDTKSGSRRKSKEYSRSRSRSHSHSFVRHSRSRSRSHSRHDRSVSSYSSKSSESHRSSSDESKSRRNHKKSGRHKKSKHRRHSKNKKKSKKYSESENEESSDHDDDIDNESNLEESDKSKDFENDTEESEKSDENKDQYSDTDVEAEEGEVSDGEIISDDNGGLEAVSDEESGEAWSSSSEDGAIE